jgi:hypothetical protein
MELKKLELLKIRAFRLHREREREREREIWEEAWKRGRGTRSTDRLWARKEERIQSETCTQVTRVVYVESLLCAKSRTVVGALIWVTGFGYSGLNHILTLANFRWNI